MFPNLDRSTPKFLVKPQFSQPQAVSIPRAADIYTYIYIYIVDITNELLAMGDTGTPWHNLKKWWFGGVPYFQMQMINFAELSVPNIFEQHSNSLTGTWSSQVCNSYISVASEIPQVYIRIYIYIYMHATTPTYMKLYNIIRSYTGHNIYIYILYIIKIWSVHPSW